MHAPDGFIDAPTSIAAGAVAVAGIGLCLRGARRELDDRAAPLAGLVATFVFAAQMVNFPVAAGTTGHLLGGALAVVLIGPWTGALAVATVVLVQALLFADGGLSALGVNLVTMSLTTALVGYAAFRLATLVLPRRLPSVPLAAGLAALVSVPASALVFVGLFALGGTAEVALGTVTAAMVGVHLLIGIGEAVITALTVASVVADRPDLVHGARSLLARRDLELRSAAPEVSR